MQIANDVERGIDVYEMSNSCSFWNMADWQDGS